MAAYHEQKKRWLGRNPDFLSKFEMGEMREFLRSVPDNALLTLDDHHEFLSMVACYRRAVDTDDFRGTNFKKTITSMMAVGEDGQYSNELRFIYELIQNVDDCAYDSPEDCHLDVQFNFNNGQIILTYNETGFTPFNVFSITGTAEAAKNIVDGKQEIGEKGIGFKSVFGVAQKVLIQSGMFSFLLDGGNCAVPVPCYQGYRGVSGTRMTLYMPSGEVERLYRQLVSLYCKPETLLQQNPILFLNKLTRLRLYYDSWRSMTFTVNRGRETHVNGMRRESNVRVAVELADYHKGAEKRINKHILCERYARDIVYSKPMILSRYGQDTSLTQTRTMAMHVLYPSMDALDDMQHGALYSFLPTQVKLSMPVLCHVPFKLDGSREFVDPQRDSNNAASAWFMHSCKEFAALLNDSCEDFAHRVGANILYYLPRLDQQHVFIPDNPKINCLLLDCFSLDQLYRRRLFRTADGTYARNAECVALEHKEPEQAYALLGAAERLFVPPRDESGASKTGPKRKHSVVEAYGIKYIKQIVPLLLARALENADVAGRIFAFINKQEDLRKQIDEDHLPKLTATAACRSIEEMAAFPAIWEIFEVFSVRAIKKGQPLLFAIHAAQQRDIRDVISPGERLQVDDMERNTQAYLQSIHFSCQSTALHEDQFFAAKNVLLISRAYPLSSFSAFCAGIRPNDLFAVNIRLSAVSQKLDRLCQSTDAVDDSLFMRDLIGLRKSAKQVLGDTAYQNFIRLIQQAGSSPQRFINELLQNADDCQYDPGVVPAFALTPTATGIQTTYNERGFTRANVRAITAIGDSTKKRIQSPGMPYSDNEIGEKGVGFKAVFAVADEVCIRSGAFHFSLSGQSPTIPALRSGGGRTHGTQMTFTCKPGFNMASYQEKDVLRLCLCLRRLKRITIGEHRVEISDTENERIITVNGNKHVFERFGHTFDITDAAAIEERSGGQLQINERQQILCYLPRQYTDREWPVYNGLPTSITTKIPMVIDAPYALTTSRDIMLKSKWNDIVASELGFILADIVCMKARAIGIDALRYLHVDNVSGNKLALSLFSDPGLQCPLMLDLLEDSAILPTYDANVYGKPIQRNVMRLPPVLLKLRELGAALGIPDAAILNDRGRSMYDGVLRFLGCERMPFGDVCKHLIRLAADYITHDDFRNALYQYLLDAANNQRRAAWDDTPIIPVLPRQGVALRYITGKQARDDLYILSGAKESGADYWLLDTDKLSLNDYIIIFGRSLREMDEGARFFRYIDSIRQRLDAVDGRRSYAYWLSAGAWVLQEFRNNESMWKRNNFQMLGLADSVIYQMQDSTLRRGAAFVCSKPGYFSSGLVSHLCVSVEYADMARFFGAKELGDAHYGDVCRYEEPLTAHDIEDIQDESGYFRHGAELLRGFIDSKQISDDLIKRYHLGVLTPAYLQDEEETDDHDFPCETVNDINRLRESIRRRWWQPNRIVRKPVMRTIPFVQYANGKEAQYSSNEGRTMAIGRYTPQGSKLCFCQMCQKQFIHDYITINNVVYLQSTYWPELRLALCWKCSSRFMDMRRNKTFLRSFLNALLQPVAGAGNGVIEIPIADQFSIRFTYKHLVEIQEIVKGHQNELSDYADEEDALAAEDWSVGAGDEGSGIRD